MVTTSVKNVSFNQRFGDEAAQKTVMEVYSSYGIYLIGIVSIVLIWFLNKLTWKSVEPFWSWNGGAEGFQTNSATTLEVEIARQQEKQRSLLQTYFLDTIASRGKGTSLYKDLIYQLAPREQFLINVCPLTVRLPGYIGPWEKGSFHPDIGIYSAYAAGVRGFFIPISTYYDDNKKPPLFPNSGDPAIVARANNGRFQSLNAGFLKKTIDLIVQHKDSIGQYSGEPVCIYLHADWKYLPNPVKEEESYVKLCSKVADSLRSISPFATNQIGSLGYTQGGNGSMILMTQARLTDLRGKIIVFSNFDLKPERNSNYSSTTAKLGDFVNILYGKEVQTGTTPTAKLLSFDGIKGAEDVIRRESTIQYHIALPMPEQILSRDDVNSAISMGIQCVPLNFIVRYTEEKDAWNSWGGAGWRLKEKRLRFVEPAPIVPQTPSTRLNAKAPGADFAGQVVIS